MSEKINYDFFKNINQKIVIEAYKNDPLVHDRVSFGFGMEMFNAADWPEILQTPQRSRPIRSTRNPEPRYT